MAFEAKSSKDYAWYDVASFRTYRVLCSGELEVKVRYAGFSNTDDEWVNVRNEVRRRSIPLEPTECNKVKVGDPVLCFQESDCTILGAAGASFWFVPTMTHLRRKLNRVGYAAGLPERLRVRYSSFDGSMKS